MKKIAIFLSLMLTLPLLQGCHSGGSSNNQSTVRLVNGTTTQLDMYWSGAASASAVASGIKYGNASSSVAATAGVSSISLASSNGGSPSAGTPFSFSGGYSYTMLAYQTYPFGSNTPSLQIAQIIDNQTLPVSGNGLIGVADYSGAGSLDVYMALVGSASNNTNSYPWASGISGLTKYFPEPQGNYQIWVTGANNPTDVRLYIPSLNIGNQQILTLALTPTTGGGLVDGLVVLQQGQTLQAGQQVVTTYKNGSARVRIAANNGSSIDHTTTNTNANGFSLLGANLSSPNLSSYVVVPLSGGTQANPTPQATGVAAATLPLTITVNGVATGVPATAMTMPGADLTLLAYGTTAAPKYSLLTDDNTLPSSGYAKLRLVNGINSIGSGTISLTYGGIPVQNSQNVALGVASTATSVLIPGGSPNALGVSGGPAFAPVSPTLLSQGVYSLFMLGDTTAASGIVSPDHSFQGP